MVERALPLELKGIKTEKNVEADQLEKLLGIVFPEKPRKISLSFQNRFRLYRNSSSIIPNIFTVLTGDTFAAGMYSPSIHTYFYPTNRSMTMTRFTNYHEKPSWV